MVFTWEGPSGSHGDQGRRIVVENLGRCARTLIPVADLMQIGMKLESEGLPKAVIAKSLGIHRHTYKVVREIYLLSQREDLSDEEKACIFSAISLIDGTKRVAKSYRMVYSIISRIRPSFRRIETTHHQQQKIESLKDSVAALESLCVRM